MKWNFPRYSSHELVNIIIAIYTLDRMVLEDVYIIKNIGVTITNDLK